MKVSGETRIFRKEINGFAVYSTNVSNKNTDGKWEKMYITVNLPKGKDLENGTDIDIKNGFLSFYKTKEGLPKIRLVIMDFDIKENFGSNDEEIMATDELPF